MKCGARPDFPVFVNRENANRVALFLYCVALVFAPFAYGCTTESTRYVLDGILVAAFLPWLAGCWFGYEPFQQPHRKVPAPLLVLIAGLILVGVSFLLNPKYRYDPVLLSISPVKGEVSWPVFLSVAPVQGAVSWLPGTLDFATSLPVVVHAVCLSLALVGLTSLCAHSRFRRALLMTMGSAGFAMAIIGIIQKASGADTMLWSSKIYDSPTFFGAYRYHGNAASFLLLSWLASFGFMLEAMKYPSKGVFFRAWWINAALITYGALFVNTSKFGHLFAIVGLIGALIVFRRQLPELTAQKKRVVGMMAVLVLFSLLALAFFGLEIVIEKWDEAINQGLSMQRRLLAYRVGLDMVGEAGPWGFGPGVNRLIMPYFAIHLGNEIAGIWTHIHQDYLQVLIEWGWVSGMVCFLLFGAGILKSGRKCRASNHQSSAFAASFLGLSIIALNALIDFPLQIASIQLYTAVLLAIAWAPYTKRTATGSRLRSGGNDRHHRRFRVSVSRSTPPAPAP